MEKYFKSDNSKLRVGKYHWFLKVDGKEKELPFPSKVASDIIIENNEITEKEYLK